MTRSPLSPSAWKCFFPGVLVPILLATGCDLPGQPNPDDKYQPPDKVLTFTPLYRQHCGGCHGADGKLGPAPPLHDAAFLAIISDRDLEAVIQRGRGPLMPAFAHDREGSLTPEQIQVLIKGLREAWGDSSLSARDLPPYAVSEEKAGSVDAGKKVFASACAGCHGSNGKGNPGKESPGAINEPAFLALITDQALRRIIITGRPDLGMPGFNDPKGRAEFKPLTDTEITDLVALLRSWRPTEAADIAPD